MMNRYTLLTILLILSMTAAARLQDGLVARYDFAENSTLVDVLSYKENGTVYGSPAIATFNNHSGWLCDGSDYSIITNSYKFKANPNLTISFWTKAAAGQDYEDVYIAKDSGLNSMGDWRYIRGTFASTNMWFSFYNISRTDLIVGPASEYSHIVIMFDGSHHNISVYINNSLEITREDGTTFNDNLNDLTICGLDDGTDLGHVYIDDLQIWDRYLTPTEMTNLFRNESVGIAYPWLEYSITEYAYDAVNNGSITNYVIEVDGANHTVTTGSIDLLINSTLPIKIYAAGYRLYESYINPANATVHNRIVPNNATVVTLYDEVTQDLYNLSKNNDTYVSAICDNNVSYTYQMNENPLYVYFNCTFEMFKVDVSSSTDTYFRTLIPDAYETDINAYIVDITQYSIVQIILELYDLSDVYIGGSAYIQKPYEDGFEYIIQQPWDVENKVVLYLLKNGIYTLKIISPNGLERSVGYITADSAGTKVITIPDVSFVPDSYYGNTVSWDWQLNRTYLRLVYNDTASETLNLTYRIFNGSNLSQLMYSTISYNVSFSSLSYATPGNGTWLACFETWHSVLNNFTECKSVYIAEEFGYWEGWTDDEINTIQNWVALFILAAIALYIAYYSESIGAFLFTVLYGVFLRLDWLSFGNPYTDYGILSIGIVITLFLIWEEGSK